MNLMEPENRPLGVTRRRRQVIQRCILCLLCIFTVTALLAGGVSGDSGTSSVSFHSAGVNLYVDDTVAEWGYITSDAPSQVRHDSECHVFTKDGATFQIAVTLAPGCSLEVETAYEYVEVTEGLVTVSDITTAVDIYLKAKDGYIVTLSDYVYGDAPVKPSISQVPSGSTVIFSYSYTSGGEGMLWSRAAGNMLNVGTYYIFATVNGVETGRTEFHVTKAPGILPAEPAVDVTNMPVVVTLNAVDAGRNLKYSVDDGQTWTSLNTAEIQAGLFSIPGLASDTWYTLLLKASGTANYHESSARTVFFKTPDLTPVYKVSYNANGGLNSPDDVSVTDGDTVEIDSGSSVYRSGYAFDGWYTEKTGGTGVAGTVTVTDNLSLYAHWTPVTFTVEFDANGGTGTMAAVTANVIESVTLPANLFQFSGKTFTGWALSENGTVMYKNQDSVKLVPDAENKLTLYAVWADDVYGVSGEVRGEDGTKVTIALMYGNILLEESGELTLTGGSVEYAFSRQVPAGVYNVVVTTGDGSIVTQIITVTGSGKLFTIDLPDSGANSVVEVKENTAQVVVGELEKEAEKNRESGKTVTIILTAEAKEEMENYEGETAEEKIQNDIQDLKQSAGQNGSTAMQYMSLDVTKKTETAGSIEKTETLTTTDTVLEIIVPFDSTDKENVTVFRKHGDSVEKLRQIFSVSGADGTFYVDTPESLVRIYSKKFCVYGFAWTEPGVVTHTITFDANGGTGFMEPKTVTREGWIVLPANAFTAPAGKEFDCWEVGGTRMYPGDTLTPVSDTTVKALWKELGTWKVAFDANGGTGTMDAVKVKKGESMTMPACGFSAPSGKTFSSWRIGSSTYTAGSAYTPTADVTAYAVWKSTGGGGGSGTTATSYCLVEFEPYDASITIEDQWLKEGSLVVKPVDPVEEGFVFGGWYTEEGKEWNFATDKVYYSMTLYAKWVPAEDRPPLNPLEPVTPVATPLGIAGVLGGLVAAGLMMRRRR